MNPSPPGERDARSGALALQVRPLLPADAELAYEVRLDGIRRHPEAFHTDEATVRVGGIVGMRERLASNVSSAGERVLFGAFVGGELVGMTGVVRESREMLRHKATIVSVYVQPERRGLGVGGRLLDVALAHAATLDGVEQLALSVVAGNEPALRLYASRGFVAWGTEPRAVRLGDRRLDEVKMRREMGTDDEVL